MIKAAYICEPQFGGTFSFYQAIRPALLDHGVELTCVPPVSRGQIARSKFRDLPDLDALDLPEDLSAATGLMINHFGRAGYQVVLTLPSTGPLAANLAPYLPPEIRCIMRVPMMTRGAYAPTRSVAGELDHIIAVSDRVADDLAGSYGIDRKKISVIYNGVAMEKVPVRGSYAQKGERPVVFFANRLSDVDKGVLLLPPFLEALRGLVPGVELWIAGDGPDRAALESGFAKRGLQEAVKMLGVVPVARVWELIQATDAYLLPSRFEGCPNSLMEAMASGAPCVAAGIKGSVAVIVEDGRSGLLFPPADAAAAARQAARLLQSESLRQTVGQGGRERILEDYTADKTAAAYAAVFKACLAAPAARSAARSLSAYTVPEGMKPTWRTRIPVPVKNLARKWLEKLGRSA